MFLDARSLGSNANVIRSDVCIVGGGPASMTMALELMKHHISVNILEAGDLQARDATQNLYRGQNTGHPYPPVDSARLRQFGGTSGHWWTGVRLRPLDSSDFEARDWVPFSGWPFGKNKLDPYYERAQRVFGLDKYDYRFDSWVEPEEDIWPVLHGGRVNTAISQFAPSDAFQRYQRQFADSADIRVYLNANVVEVECEETPGSVSGIRAITLQGISLTAKARVYVLAAGGIENPRLMLLSRRYPAGLGNQNDLVGRFFTEHVNLRSGRIFPPQPGLVRKAGLYSRHTRRGSSIGATLILDSKTCAEQQIGNVWAMLWPDDEEMSTPGAVAVRELLGNLRHYQHLPGGLPRELRNLVRDAAHRAFLSGEMAYLRHAMRDLPSIAASGFRYLTGKRRTQPNLLQLRFMGEQVPNPESRITLSSHRDSLGLNTVQLNWQLSDLDTRTIVRAQRVVDSELRSRGMGYVDSFYEECDPPPRISGSWHHMGTTRMHDDAKRGVVDANCRVHGIANLFVAGSSVFPTGGYANPTLTIVALALRLADHLKSEVASPPLGVANDRHLDTSHKGRLGRGPETMRGE